MHRKAVVAVLVLVLVLASVAFGAGKPSPETVGKDLWAALIKKEAPGIAKLMIPPEVESQYIETAKKRPADFNLERAKETISSAHRAGKPKFLRFESGEKVSKGSVQKHAVGETYMGDKVKKAWTEHRWFLWYQLPDGGKRSGQVIFLQPDATDEWWILFIR